MAVWPGRLARPFFIELSFLGGWGARPPRAATLFGRYCTWIDGLRV
nr:MAG TPA: hypothetical protein [Inoviridae sp.]